MKKIQLYLLLCVVAFSTGCPTRPSKSFKNKDTFVSNVNEYLRQQQIDYNNAVSFMESLGPGTAPDVVERAANKARRIRNDAIEDAVAVVDDNYTAYIDKLNNRRSTTEFVADVIELGTAAATGIVNGERPNQILGIALTAFRGGRRSAELQFYKEQTTPILISKMDGNRAEIYATMLKRKDDPVTDYSMKEAIRDIVAYYNAGTLIRAFTQLAKDTAAQAKESENRVLILKGVPVTPPATEAERNAAVSASDTLFRLRKSLRDTATPEERADATNKLQAIVQELKADPQIAPLLEVDEGETDGSKLLRAIVGAKRKAFDNADLSKKIDQVIVSKGT